MDITDKNTELKIIHLVRDPRAILASMYRQPKAWVPYLKTGNGTILCENMIRNKIGFEEMIKEGMLTPKNFAEVNYDLWMENTWGTIVQIYQFLEIPLTTDIVDNIQAHFSDEVARKSYLSTFQGSDHDKDQWRTQLSQDQQRYIENKCDALLEDETENYEEVSTEETKEPLVIRSCIDRNLDSQCGVLTFKGQKVRGCMLTCKKNMCNSSDKLTTNLKFWTLLFPLFFIMM